MKDSRKRATLKDVAKEAGVSVSAVSTVMNGNKYGISPLTAEKILAAASSLGYAPNTAARALKTNSSKTIGVITASHYHSYHTDILIGINEAAVQAGYVVITHYTNRTAESERSGMEFMLKHNVDGLIFISPSDTSIRALTHIKNSGIPSVFIERLAQINGNDVISSVLSDNAGGG